MHQLFEFGGNAITTIIVLSILLCSRRSSTRRIAVSYPNCDLISFSLLPTTALCSSSAHAFILFKQELKRAHVDPFEWVSLAFYSINWAIILSARCANMGNHFLSRALCAWWIVKSALPIVDFPQLSSLGILRASTDVIFAISINFTRFKKGRRENSNSIEDPLLENDEDDMESYWSSMAFGSISSVMDRGIEKQLEFDDLMMIPDDMKPSICHQALATQFAASTSLFPAIFRAYGWFYIRLGFLKGFNDSLGFLGPIILNRLIKCLQEGRKGGCGSTYGYVLALLLGAVSVFKSFCDTQYTFSLSKLKLKVRSGITTLIYQKCLNLKISERSSFSDGEIQTFMSIDSDRTVNLVNSFHDGWSLPFQIAVALYLLYTQVKFAFLSGLAITILLIPVNKWISEKIAKATDQMMKQKDERIRRTGEILDNVRTLKMYGWESIFSSWLFETRETEVKHLATRKYLDAWCVFFWATTPTLFSVFTFGLFSLMGHELDAATVFTCLALFNNLISPLNSFPWVINGLIDAFISIRRLNTLLSCDGSSRVENSPDSDAAVTMVDAYLNWCKVPRSPVLNNLSIILPRGKLIAVIGEVGCGKSSFLNAILGELNLTSGSISCNSSISYVSQVPWIMSGTLRDNVLLGKDFDSSRYYETLAACALYDDVSRMAGRDMTYVGDKGFNLSGGQRTRVALARAIYSDSDMILLDDVLSSVDAEVAKWILSNAILGPLCKKRTRVLSTHNVHATSAADLVVVLNQGTVQWFGCCKNELLEQTEREPDQNEPSVRAEIHAVVEEEVRKEGRVEFSVYNRYAAFSGRKLAVFIFLSAFLMQGSRNGNDLWLSHWVDDEDNRNPVSFYLNILFVFCLVNSVLTLIRAFSFAYGGLRAATSVHNILFSKIIDAPVAFFEKTPTGRILNRLSSDLYTVDDSLPFILNILLANFVGVLGVAVVLSFVQPALLLLLIPFWFIYSKLQFFYRSTSREIRRLDSVTRSPIYSTFSETLDGSSTIRAFGSEDLFMAKFVDLMTMYQRTSYSEATANVWLALRLQLLAAVVISFVALAAVVKTGANLGSGSPGLVGLALSYATPIVTLMGSVLSSFTETEKEMVSVERTVEYMTVPQEDLRANQSVGETWPTRGAVEFRNVTMRYATSPSSALNSVSFVIEGGRKVAIVGRTGAGKSSVLNSLFCISPISNGCILIDSVDINTVPIRTLRSNIAIVPQSPFLFEGSLRDNLDPMGRSTDASLWSVLEKCQMKEAVECSGGIDVVVKGSGSSFSVGQKQLICLARALLRYTKILCLDECTASMDNQTAEVLVRTIETECEGVTLISIAHRISTVMNMDRILVLEYGRLVEEGNPQALLQDSNSRFFGFAKVSNM